jgi:DNA-binding NtrC family response regulator
MRASLRLLLVNECDDDAVLIARAFRRAGIALQCERVASADAFARALRAPAGWDMVVCDAVVPRWPLQRMLDGLRRVHRHPLVMVITGRGGEEAFDAIDHDSVDVLVNKDHIRDLPAIVRSMLSGAWPSRAATIRAFPGGH